MYALKFREEAFLSQIYISERELRKVFKDNPTKPPENYMQIQKLSVGRNYSEIFKKKKKILIVSSSSNSKENTDQGRLHVKNIAGKKLPSVSCVLKYITLWLCRSGKNLQQLTQFTFAPKKCILKTPPLFLQCF